MSDGFRVTLVVDVSGPVWWSHEDILRRVCQDVPWASDLMQMSGDHGGYASLESAKVEKQ